MASILRGLVCGVLLVGLGIRGAAQADVESGVGRSNLKLPLTPLDGASVPRGGIVDHDLEAELYRLAAQAGVIFAGEVLAIRREGGAGTGWVDVEFRVTEAVRGCGGPGTIYRLREWAGLWAGGIERYRLGERLLMLLHAPSAGGLSSPVGGQDGAIPITGSGAAPGPEDEFAGTGEQAIDLRWIGARVERPAFGSHEQSLASASASIGPVYAGREERLLGVRKSVVSGVRGGADLSENGFVAAPTQTTFDGSGDALSADGLEKGSTLRVVMAMLGAWEAQQAHAGR